MNTVVIITKNKKSKEGEDDLRATVLDGPIYLYSRLFSSFEVLKFGRGLVGYVKRNICDNGEIVIPEEIVI